MPLCGPPAVVLETVWYTSSLFVQCTVDPFVTVIACGENALSLIVTFIIIAPLELIDDCDMFELMLEPVDVDDDRELTLEPVEDTEETELPVEDMLDVDVLMDDDEDDMLVAEEFIDELIDE